MPPVQLRGHHFICLQFFRGSGYDRRFVANLSSVVSRATRHPARVVLGADDVCHACPWLSSGSVCASASSGGELEIQRLDLLAREILELEPGDFIALRDVGRRLRGNPEGVARWRDEACTGCSWENPCTAEFSRVLG